MQKAFLAIAKGAKSVNTQWNISNLKKKIFFHVNMSLYLCQAKVTVLKPCEPYIK